MTGLSVVIIAFNEENNILRCLNSVKPVAGEIVVVDSMSTDRTAEICRSFGCKVFQRVFDGFGSQKQFAVDQASNNWILSIDADEILSEELQKEITLLFLPESGIRYPAFRIPFSFHYLGRILKYSGVGNEFHLRLFDRTKGCFTTVPVHEGIKVKGEIGTLKGKIIHYSYRDISHHLEKLNMYASRAAEGYVREGRSFSKLWLVLKFPIGFFTVYILKGGFLDGYPGFMWSFLAAFYSTLKVAKTIEIATRK